MTIAQEIQKRERTAERQERLDRPELHTGSCAPGRADEAAVWMGFHMPRHPADGFLARFPKQDAVLFARRIERVLSGEVPSDPVVKPAPQGASQEGYSHLLLLQKRAIHLTRTAAGLVVSFYAKGYAAAHGLQISLSRAAALSLADRLRKLSQGELVGDPEPAPRKIVL